jgi:hypothetical protein
LPLTVIRNPALADDLRRPEEANPVRHLVLADCALVLREGLPD